jgi:hypothetical protein
MKDESKKIIEECIHSLNAGSSIKHPIMKKFFDEETVETHISDNPKALVSKIYENNFEAKNEFDVFNLMIYKKNDNTFDYATHYSDQNKISEQLSKDHLEYIGRKNPKIMHEFANSIYSTASPSLISKFFNNIIENKFLFNMNDDIKKINKLLSSEDGNIYEIMGLLRKYDIDDKVKNLESLIFLELKQNNTQIVKELLVELKSQNNIINVLRTNTKEGVDDIISLRTKQHQHELILNNKLTVANKTLFSKDSMRILKELTSEGLTAKLFHKEFGKKIAKYKNKEDLQSGIKQYASIKRGWSRDIYDNKISKLSLSVEEIKSNVLMIEIPNYEISKELGSSSWCISTDERYFEQYTENYSRQYFIFDLNKEPSDEMSMIGATFDYNGKITNAHNKYDHDIIREVDILEKFVSPMDKNILATKIMDSTQTVFKKYAKLRSIGLVNESIKLQTEIIKQFKLGEIFDKSYWFDDMHNGTASEISEVAVWLEHSLQDQPFDLLSNFHLLKTSPSKELFQIYEKYWLKSSFDDKCDLFKNIVVLDINKIKEFNGLSLFKTIFNDDNVHPFDLLQNHHSDDYKEYGVGSENVKLNRRQNILINILSDECNFNEIIDHDHNLNKIKHNSFYTAVALSENNSADFKNRFLNEIPSDMYKRIIDILLEEEINPKQLRTIDFNHIYQDNFFETIDPNEMEDFNVLLWDYSDEYYESDFYQDLFDYAKNNNKKKIANIVIAQNPLLRKRLIDDGTIKDLTYLIALKNFHNKTDQVFSDKELHGYVMTDIRDFMLGNKEYDQEHIDVKESYIMDYFHQSIEDKTTTAKIFKKDLGQNFNKLPKKIKDEIGLKISESFPKYNKNKI